MKACEHWNNELLGVAAGEGIGRAMEMHLAACAACSAALSELRARCAQIDAGVRALVTAGPSPDFHAHVLIATETAPQWSVFPAKWAAAFAALVLSAGMLFLSAGGEPAATPARTTQTLSEWQSPTNSLLRTPNQELLRQGPQLGEFYFSINQAPATAGASHRRRS